MYRNWRPPQRWTVRFDPVWPHRGPDQFAPSENARGKFPHFDSIREEVRSPGIAPLFSRERGGHGMVQASRRCATLSECADDPAGGRTSDTREEIRSLSLNRLSASSVG